MATLIDPALRAAFFREGWSSLPTGPEGLLSARRIGVPGVEILSGEGDVVPLPPGRPLPSVGPHLFRWASGRLRFELPSPGGTVFCQSWDDVDRCISVLERFTSLLEDAPLTDGAREAELDNARKAVLEAGKTGVGHISPEGITNTADSSIPGMEYFGAWLHHRYVTEVGPDWTLDMKVVRNTSHGWPSYVSGGDPASNVDLLAHIWLAGALADAEGDLADVSDRMARLGYHGPPLSAQMFSRTGPLAKPTPHYVPSLDGEALRVAAVSRGLFCRERQVFAVPTFLNLFLRPAATRVKYALRTDPSFKHTTGARFAETLKGYPHLKFFSEDISGYDRSVTLRMQRDLEEHVYARFMTSAERRAYHDLQTLPVLAPPLVPGSEGFLYERAGMTISGSIFTTNDGTCLNVISIAHAVSEALSIPLDEIWARKGVDWEAFVLGDDCVVGMRDDSPSVRARYLAARRSVGFKTELFDGVVFLMNTVARATGVVSGVLSRAISKTYFREHPATSLHVDLFGLYYRWERSRAHPLFSWAWDQAVAAHPAARDLGVTSFETLSRIVTNPAFVRTLLEEARTTAHKRAVRDLLTGIGRGELTDALSALPPAFAFFGGAAIDDLVADLSYLTVADALAVNFRFSRTTWEAYLKSRFGGASPSDAARRAGVPLSRAV